MTIQQIRFILEPVGCASDDRLIVNVTPAVLYKCACLAINEFFSCHLEADHIPCLGNYGNLFVDLVTDIHCYDL